MEHNTKGQAFGLLVFTFFIWGSVYVGGKVIAGDLPPALVACLLLISLDVALSVWETKRLNAAKK